MRRLVTLPALALLAAACDGGPTAPRETDPGLPQRYTVVPFTPPPGTGDWRARAVAINNRGQVLLDEPFSGRFLALWSGEGTTTLFPPPWEAQAHGLSDAGRIVGCTSAFGAWVAPEQRPIIGEGGRVWYLAGRGLERACAHDVNDAGTVVGMTVLGGRQRAFVLSQAQVTFVDVPGDTAAEAIEVNERGRVLLSSWRWAPEIGLTSRVIRGSLWRDGVLTELGRLEWAAAGPGQVADVTRFSNVPGDLNERDEVVGTSSGMVCTPDGRTCSGRSRAFLWRSGKMLDLGRTHEAKSSSAVAINRWGHVLLRLHEPGGAYTPLLWNEGTVLDLNEAIAATGWKLENVTDLNDRGQVTGSARRGGTGDVVAVRLDPA